MDEYVDETAHIKTLIAKGSCDGQKMKTIVSNLKDLQTFLSFKSIHKMHICIHVNTYKNVYIHIFYCRKNENNCKSLLF
jgi:hypothetical protein